ncbi:MAG TPA: CrcB family protein [Acidimicrobiales bacterium]
MNGLLVVGAAGAVGAVGRHLLDVGLRRPFPDGPSVGILVANVIGSFVLGVLSGVAAGRVVDPDLRLAVGVGFCGGLTTFSTFSAQLAEQVETGRRSPALRWTALMLVSGVVAAAVGVGLGRSF